jgi:DNA mismatch repair ATPase MutS
MSLWGEHLRGLWLAGGCLLLAGFLALVALHEHVLRGLARHRRLREINEQSLARVHRRWGQTPHVDVRVAERDQSLARDIDLFGRASLFHLICTANTPIGVDSLRDWLLDPAAPAVIERRQRSVAELAPQLDLRQEVNLRGRLLSASRAGPQGLLDWAEGERWLAHRPWLKWLARLLPLLAAVCAALTLSKLLPPQFGGGVVLAAVIANVVVSVVWTGRIHDIFDRVSSRHGEVEQYCGLFELICGMPSTSEELAQIKGEIADERRGARRQVARLSRVVRLANVRRAPISRAVYILLQLLLLWDFHVLTLLERWQLAWGRHVRRWFEALGQFEALCSLASLAHDNPAWAFPRVEAEAPRVLEATGLGHPLLPDSERVANDVKVGPPGTFLLVTGSNMSGKSTLLRALGLNVALAQAGGPVCAAQLRAPPLAVASSMRVQDSLEEGVSQYLAELKRLKEIVDEASRRADRPGTTLLYLLDEILQGTNSVERHIAVETVLAHLVAQGAIGAVSTHDLTLAEGPRLADACRPVHFRESFHKADGRETMTFDYKLRPGVATTTNALKLLEIVGLATKREER